MWHLSDVRLGRYVGGELSRAARGRAARHLVRCRSCRRRVEELRRLLHDAQHLTAPVPPPEVRERVLAAVASGTRSILPSAELESRNPVVAARRVAVGVVAVLAVLASGATLTDSLWSDARELTFFPAQPEAGQRVRIDYRSDGRFAGNLHLALRARFRRPGDAPYDSTAERVGTLIRQGSGRDFTGYVDLPDSVVYAVFVVEDERGSRLDSHGMRGWDLLVHGGGIPTLPALMQQHTELLGRDWESALHVIRQATARYPDEPGVWQWLSAMSRQLERLGVEDTILGALRSEYQRLIQPVLQQGDIDDYNSMLFWALDLYGLGSAEAAYWRRLMLETAPNHPLTVRQVVAVADLAGRGNPTAVLRTLDSLWLIHGPTIPELPGIGFLVSLEAGVPEQMLRWGERLRSTDPRRAFVVAKSWSQTPGLRQNGVDVLETELAALSRRRPSRDLFVTVPAHDRDIRDQSARLHATMGHALLSLERTDEAMRHFAMATELVTDFELFATVAKLQVSAGDTAAALEMFGRQKMDPTLESDSAAAIDRSALLLLDGDDEAWRRVQRRAARAVRDRVLARSVNRRWEGDLLLRDRQGELRTARDVIDRSVTVVAFWSRWCLPAILQLPRLTELREELAADGASVAVITTEAWTPEFQAFWSERAGNLPIYHDVERGGSRVAFNAWITPQYYVIDASGRVRFEVTSLHDIPLQVAALLDAAEPLAP